MKNNKGLYPRRVPEYARLYAYDRYKFEKTQINPTPKEVKVHKTSPQVGASKRTMKRLRKRGYTITADGRYVRIQP